MFCFVLFYWIGIGPGACVRLFGVSRAATASWPAWTRLTANMRADLLNLAQIVQSIDAHGLKIKGGGYRCLKIIRVKGPWCCEQFQGESPIFIFIFNKFSENFLVGSCYTPLPHTLPPVPVCIYGSIPENETENENESPFIVQLFSVVCNIISCCRGMMCDSPNVVTKSEKQKVLLSLFQIYFLKVVRKYFQKQRSAEMNYSMIYL